MYGYFALLRRLGLLTRALARLARGSATAIRSLDASYVRVHQDGANPEGGQKRELMGRSRGGLTLKVHLLCDSRGRPLRVLVGAGERPDICLAAAMVAGLSGGTLCAAIPTASSHGLAVALLGLVWSWDPEGGNDGTVRFFADGTAKHSRVWTATWKLEGPRTLVLSDSKDPKKTSRLNFDAAGQRYEGIGFSGKASIRGTRLERSTLGSNPAGTTPSSAGARLVALSSTASQPSSVSSLVLSANWNTPMQGGSSTLQDLAQLFSAAAKPGTNLAADPAIQVYEGVPYLAPFQQALKALGITSRPPSKNMVACAGLPRESFFYYAADGNFGGHYNRMYAVVDKADQIVSVQLVDETPREQARSPSSRYD